jgi:hypothetical protein
MRRESRPGVVLDKLTRDEARRKVIAVANAAPQLSVLGIAGPRRRLLRLEEDEGHLRGAGNKRLFAPRIRDRLAL